MRRVARIMEGVKQKKEVLGRGRGDGNRKEVEREEKIDG